MAHKHFTSIDTPLAEMNMVPLIDVMLVLLVIFIVTAPLLTHAVKIDLPRASSAIAQTPETRVHIAIEADGGTLWNGEAVDRKQLENRLAAQAKDQPDAELWLHADRGTAYENVATVIALASRRGLSRIAFVSQPESAP